MLKTAGMGLVLGGCIAMGISAGREMERRVKDLRELQKMLDILEGEIGYANAALAECFRHGAGRLRKPFADFLEGMSCRMEEFTGGTMQEIMRESVERELKQTALLPQDLEQLCSFGEQLGYLDVKMQLAAIKLYRSQLEESCQQALEKYRSSARVYRCLGLMGGLFLAIIFI